MTDKLTEKDMIAYLDGKLSMCKELSKEKDKLLEAAEQERQEGWRPISESGEVKKNGQFVLVYGAPVFSGSCIAQWIKPHTGCDYGWYTPEISIAINPTHFRCLPNPPIEESRE